MQTKNNPSTGICPFCQKSKSKQQMPSHLHTHLKKMGTEYPAGKSFLVSIHTNPHYGGNTPYFLALWIDGNSSFEVLATFLENIWLGTDNYLPGFYRDTKETRLSGIFDQLTKAQELYFAGNQDEYFNVMEKHFGHVHPKHTFSETVSMGQKFNYQYPKPDTIHLQLKIVTEYTMGCPDQLVLLAQNEAPKINCQMCIEEPATEVCPVCDRWLAAYFCTACAARHKTECPNYAAIAPVYIENTPCIYY